MLRNGAVSHWFPQLPAPRPALPGDRDADVCIVGAGYTGLWTAYYLKQLDPKHLVAESYFTDPDNAGVDIVQDHLYQGDPVKMIEQIQASVKRAAGRKVYMVGEFGFVSTEGMRPCTVLKPCAAPRK